MSKQSELNAAYRAVRENYLRNLRSMERRGYVFEGDPRPSIPKRITEGSIRRIQNLNKGRYDHATRNGYRGEEARRQERIEAAGRKKQRSRANDARKTIDQLGAAIRFEIDQAPTGGTTEKFLDGIMGDIEEIADRAEEDDAYAIFAANELESNWDEIQKAIEIIEYYEDVEDAPGELVDRLILIIRRIQGKPVTQEDMRTAGTMGEDPDYYPKE